jgi:hypothetical protein
MKKILFSVLLCTMIGMVPVSSQTVLWDNGPMITQEGAGANGADISELQTNLTMNTLGFGNQIPNDNRLADDFVISPEDDEWNITSITLFAYQTGSYSHPPVSTMNDVRVQISDGPPWEGGTVVWGDLTTNRMSETGWTGIQRVTDTTTQDTSRPIMYLQCDVDITLEPGTYYLEWTLGGTGSSGPWYPPITILGMTTTGDAYQYTSTGWAPAIDSGTSTQQGMPFVLEGAGGETMCPPGSIPEGEPLCHEDYEDDYNGGCNSAPYVFQDIECGDVICGESGTYLYDGSDIRDTDWYRLELANSGTIIWTVEAEFPVQVLMIDALAEDCISFDVLEAGSGAPFEVVELSANVGPGVYWLWVGPSVFTGIPCGSEYVAEVTCDITTPTPPPSPTPTPTPGPECINHGDVNLDGILSAADAQLAFFIVLGTHVPTFEEECAADCNGDGVVTAADAQAIFLTVLGQGTCADPL